MNRHFEDTRYYLSRTTETARAGVAEELDPLRTRVRGFLGRESETPEPGRLESTRRDVRDLASRVEAEGRETARRLRDRVDSGRRTA